MEHNFVSDFQPIAIPICRSWSVCSFGRTLMGMQIVLRPTADRVELSGDYAGLIKLVCGPKIKYSLGYQKRKGPQSRWTNWDRG